MEDFKKDNGFQDCKRTYAVIHESGKCMHVHRKTARQKSDLKQKLRFQKRTHNIKSTMLKLNGELDSKEFDHWKINPGKCSSIQDNSPGTEDDAEGSDNDLSNTGRTFSSVQFFYDSSISVRKSSSFSVISDLPTLNKRKDNVVDCVLCGSDGRSIIDVLHSGTDFSLDVTVRDVVHSGNDLSQDVTVIDVVHSGTDLSQDVTVTDVVHSGNDLPHDVTVIDVVHSGNDLSRDVTVIDVVHSGNDLSRDVTSNVDSAGVRYSLRRQFSNSLKCWDIGDMQHNEDIRDFYRHLLCAERLTQMTRAYNDIEAVNRLLEEKERDLELAARIGQTLLQKNEDLANKNESLEERASEATEKLNQLKHEILRKDDLLQALTHPESDGTPSDESPNGNTEILYGLGAASLQRKVRNLEEENIRLHIETVHLSEETCDYEEKEHKLVSDCLEQLGDVKQQIEVYAEELVQKTHETSYQKEEITSLLAQVVDLQKKCKVLTAENLELQKHLEASQLSQKHLTKELVEYKEKHDELLELLEENQDEMRRLRRLQKPNVAKHSYLSSSLLNVRSDSLASELENSLKSEQDYPVGCSPAERKVHNWRIFETAKAAKKASNKQYGISNSNSYGTDKTSGISCMSGLSGLSMLSLDESVDGGASTTGISGAASSVGRLKPPSNRSSTYFSDVESVQSDGYAADLDSLYGEAHKKHSLGRPGIPGSNDLETALRKLSMRRANELNEDDYFEEEKKHSRQRTLSQRSDAQESADTTGVCRTPDSTLSTGSFRSGFSQQSYPGSNSSQYRLPDKLKIIKPLEGSVTLRQWQQLATPHLGGIFEARPGVQNKGERKLDLHEEEVYHLSDFEEDDEYEDNSTECYKRFQDSSTVNTYTNSMVKHPTQLVSDDESDTLSDLEHAESTSTATSTPRLKSMTQSGGTTTYSMSLGLAAILHERDLLNPSENSTQTSQANNPSRMSSCLVSESHFDLEKSRSKAITTTSMSTTGVVMSTGTPSTVPQKPNSLAGLDYQEANFLNRIKNTGYSLYGYIGKIGLGQRSDSVVSPMKSPLTVSTSQQGAIPKVSSASISHSSSVDNLVTIVSTPEGKSEAGQGAVSTSIFGPGSTGGGLLGAMTSFRKSGIF